MFYIAKTTVAAEQITMRICKEAFCTANAKYGYGRSAVTSDDGVPGPKFALVIDKLRAEEFPSLIGGHKIDVDQPEVEEGPADIVYLDHAGCTLYARSQLKSVFQDMQRNVFGNPHTQGMISQATGESIRNVSHHSLCLC